MVTFEIVIFEFPPLVKETGRALLLPMLTLEKFRLVWLALRTNVAAVTVSVAAALVALPAEFVTVTVNCDPLSAVVVAGVVYEVEVAPLIAVPPLFHWYVMGAVPVAAMTNVAVCPAITVLLAGCVVMDGAVAGTLTVSVAALLVTLVTRFETVTVNCALLSEETAAGVV
jgi:hypothetical protein